MFYENKEDRSTMARRSRNSEMMTTTEVAKLLHVHTNTVRHRANRELIHTYRLGPRGDRRFTQEDVDTFIRHNGNKPNYNSKSPIGLSGLVS